MNEKVKTEEQSTIQTIALDFRCGYVALVGEPNVGKSTLMNAILETKLSIVSFKPQTTRRRVVGFHNTESHQIIFVDTPGIIEPKYLLQKSMMDSTASAIDDCDALVVLLDAEKSERFDQVIPKNILQKLTHVHCPIILVLNKSDRLKDKKRLLPLIEKCNQLFSFHAIIPLSALKCDGIDSFLTEIERVLPIHPPFFPPDEISEQPIRFFVSEIIREKIFQYYWQEIPYSTEVIIVSYEERDEGKDFISADILVERETQKQILIGEGGSALKKIGTNARRDIEKLVEKSIFLELHVKVREGWRNNSGWLKNLGYEVR